MNPPSSSQVSSHQPQHRINMPKNSDPDNDSPKGKSTCIKTCFLCLVMIILILPLYIAYKITYYSSLALIYMIFVVCFIVASIIAIPLLMASFLVIRFLLFILGCGKAYDVATKLSLIILTWLNIDGAILSIVLLIYYGVAHIPSLNHVKIFMIMLRFPLLKFIKTYLIIYGLYSFNYFLSILIIRYVILCIPSKHHTLKGGSLVIPYSVQEIISCLIFWYGEHVVMERHPFLKHYKIFRVYPVHKSIHVVIIVFLLYNLIKLSIYMIVWPLHDIATQVNFDEQSALHQIAKRVWGRRSLVYWADGIKSAIVFMFSMVMLFLAWVLYFGLNLEKHGTTKAEELFNFGIWTCLTLLIYSILWLIKTCILLLVENRAIYSRLDTKIKDGAQQLYFLGVIGGHSKRCGYIKPDISEHDIFKLLYYGQRSGKRPSLTDDKRHNCIQKIKKTFLFEPLREQFHFHLEGFVDWKKKGRINNAVSGFITYVMITFFPAKLLTVAQRFQSESDHPADWWERSPDDLRNEEEKVSREIKEDTVLKLSMKKKTKVKNELLMPAKRQETMEVTLYELQQMFYYFLAARKTLLGDKYESEILQDVSDIMEPNHPHVEKRKTGEEALQSFIELGSENHETTADPEDGDWNHFKSLIAAPNNSSSVSLDDVKAWVKKARNNCVSLANTLASAKELVLSLDKIMSAILLVAAFVLWLLLTGLATYKVLALFFGPLVGAAFIIGETCRSFVQGIAFVYLMHSFEVGDLCVIDGSMLEVKTVGVWKTTFTKVDTQVEVIYPNIDLMKKNIMNYKTGFDWNCNMKVHVSSMDNVMIKNLKQEIQRYVKAKYKCEECGIQVLTSKKNTTKLIVGFQLKDEKIPRDKLLQNKSDAQAELILYVQELMKNNWSKLQEIIKDSKNAEMSIKQT